MFCWVNEIWRLRRIYYGAAKPGRLRNWCVRDIRIMQRSKWIYWLEHPSTAFTTETIEHRANKTLAKTGTYLDRRGKSSDKHERSNLGRIFWTATSGGKSTRNLDFRKETGKCVCCRRAVLYNNIFIVNLSRLQFVGLTRGKSPWFWRLKLEGGRGEKFSFENVNKPFAVDRVNIFFRDAPCLRRSLEKRRASFFSVCFRAALILPPPSLSSKFHRNSARKAFLSPE